MVTSDANIQKVIKGYACKCGFRTDKKTALFGHIGGMRRRDGHDAHESLGQVNLINGEMILPPYKERTLEQIYETKRPEHSEHPTSETAVQPDKKSKGSKPVTATEVLSHATQIRFVPRMYTCNLTPIMLLGYEVAQAKWGWRADMPFENYLDTVIYNYFFEHGTKLQAAITIVEDEEFNDGHEGGE